MMRPVRKRLPPTKTPDRYGAQLADAAASAGVVAVGQVGAPYGVRGWLRIVSFTLPPSNLLNYRPWHLRLPQGSGKADGRGRWDRCDLRTLKPHGEGFIASFFGVADRDAALRLSGAEIGVPAGSLPPLPADEFYWRDLIGLRVLNQRGKELGLVERLLPTGGHDVLVVQGGAEALIPFVEPYVVDVRVQEGCIHVDWDGLD